MAKILFYGNSGEDEKVAVERIRKHLAEINRIISKLMDKYEINEVIHER